MADDLRARLIAAELAADANPWIAHTNEEAADRALAVVAEWLLDEADGMERRGADEADAVEHFAAGYVGAMADQIRSLAQPSTGAGRAPLARLLREPFDEEGTF